MVGVNNIYRSSMPGALQVVVGCAASPFSCGGKCHPVFALCSDEEMQQRAW